jgi:hypothetical protein
MTDNNLDTLLIFNTCALIVKVPIFGMWAHNEQTGPAASSTLEDVQHAALELYSRSLVVVVVVVGWGGGGGYGVQYYISFSHPPPPLNINGI